MMRAASGTETVRETEEVLLVYRVEQCGRRPLDNLVFQGGDRERALPAVRLGNILSPGRQCPIRSPLDPCVQIQEVGLPVRRIGLPCQPVHARGRFPLDGKESVPQQFDVDWWKSAVNRSFFLSLAVCRMRASTCGTAPRLCVRSV